MYDQSLGGAMNYGNIGPKRRRSPYTDWLDQEESLYPDQQQQQQPPPLNRAILKNPPPPARKENAMGGMYNNTTPTAPTGYQARYFTPTGNMRQDLTSAYQNLLGREPDPEGFEANMRNPGGYQGALNTIYNSDEYKNLQQQQQSGNTVASPADPSGALNPTGGSLVGDERGGEGSPLQNAIKRQGWGFTSRTGGDQSFDYTPMNMGDTSQFEGFNFDNRSERDLASAKYVFAQFASQVDVTQPDALQQVVALMNQHGIPARQVGPDSIDLGMGEGPMDVIRGGNPAAGIPNIAWQWIPGAGAAQGSPGGMSNVLKGGASGALNPLQSAVSGGDNNILAQILMMLQGQLGGQA